MVYRVTIELSSIRSMDFDFDNFMDAATFATMAKEHGLVHEYMEETPKSPEVFIHLLAEENPTNGNS